MHTFGKPASLRLPWRPMAASFAVLILVACGGGAGKKPNASPTTATTTGVPPTEPPTEPPTTTAPPTEPPVTPLPTTRPPATQPATTAAPTSPPATQPTTAAVTVTGFAFSPPTLTVKPGTKVTWTNQDDTAHSIMDTSSMHTPVSDSLPKGATFSIVYRKTGTYAYICGIHNYMMGSVIVK